MHVISSQGRINALLETGTILELGLPPMKLIYSGLVAVEHLDDLAVVLHYD